MKHTALLAIVLGIVPWLLGACSGLEAPPFAWESTDPPRLRDSEIRMTTLRSFRRPEDVDERVIRCADGRVTISVKNRDGFREEPLPVREYGRLWETFDQARVFELGVDNPDVATGYYHEFRVRMGDRAGRFSAQYRPDLLVFTTRAVMERMDLVAAVTEICERYATPPPLPSSRPTLRDRPVAPVDPPR